MKRITAILAIALSLIFYATIGSAQNTATIGNAKLRGGLLQIGLQEIVAKQVNKMRPIFISNNGSMEAETIRVSLGKGAGGKLSFLKGEATGGVIVHCKQVDAKTKTVKIVDATSQSASMVQGENTIVLVGNVVAKVTDPQQSAEPTVLTGERVTIFFKESKVLSEGIGDKAAELTFIPKEASKK